MKSIPTPVYLKNLLLAALASLVLSSMAIGADMTLTASSDKPSANVILETSVSANITGTRKNTQSDPASRWNGVTFSLKKSYDISAISFNAKSIYKNLTGENFELLLVDMAGRKVSYKQEVTLGKVIGTYTAVAAIDQNFPDQVWLTFDIGGKTLRAGDYAFILTLPGDSIRTVNTFAAADQSISHGFMSTDKGASYMGSGAPLVFIIQGSSR
jgi:hypothetical protein